LIKDFVLFHSDVYFLNQKNGLPGKQVLMKAKSFSLTAVTISLALSISACTTNPKVVVISGQQGAHAAEIKLADAADSVSQSLRELAEIEKATHPQAKLPSPPEPDMIGMGQIASIDWSGPVGPLVKKIADASHYKLHVLGTPPAIPILVSIAAKDTPLADILRDAGFQCGRRANIVVYPGSKIIELRYNKNNCSE
jgi:defect in organelle trafficking protein DotD